MRILQIEDNAGDVRLVREMLKELPGEYEVSAFDTLKSGMEFLASAGTADVVLLDMGLPDASGLEGLTAVQSQFPQLPIVIMSSANDELLAVDAVKHGAQDYLVKGLETGVLLGRALTYAIERKQMSDALRTSEEQYRRIVETSQEGIWTSDPNGAVTFANDQMALMLGRTKEELIGKHGWEFTSDESEREASKQRNKEYRKGVSRRYEVWFKRNDGSLFCALATASPMFDAQGHPVGNLGMYSDITDLKKTQESLLMERQRLQTLIDMTPAGIAVVDGESGRVIIVNHELRRITGTYSEPADAPGMYADSLILHKPDGSVFGKEEHPLRRAISRGEAMWGEEVTLEAVDGRKVPALCSTVPLFSSDGKVSAAIAVVQDLTPIEEVQKLRSEFIGIVSHELKTPLTAIKGAAATALWTKQPFSPADNKEMFKIIDEQADRLTGLVNNLQDMTRIDGGTLSVSPAPANLREVLSEACATFAQTGAGRKVELHVPPELPQVAADRTRIGQVLTNLLGNAAKFSPATSPIDIDVQADQMQVTVRVRDQGRGIAKDQLPLLFKKFSRLHEAGAPRVEGTGLGLAICKGIVEAHGGRISAESPGPGQGSTFTFTLPLAVEGAPPAAAADVTKKASHVGTVRRAGERTTVLAVDDEPQVLRAVQRILEEAGYNPLTTGDPSEVMKRIESEEPDLILLDLNMPGTNGFELLKRIREFTGTPVIFLTSSGLTEDVTRALNLGADDYVTKPFSPSELVARVGASLRRRTLPDTVEAKAPFESGALKINFAERLVTVDGQAVALSATEYKLLYEMATHAGRILTHDQILTQVWGQRYAGAWELLRSVVRNLRHKLNDDARSPRFIFNERNVGYRMVKG